MKVIRTERGWGGHYCMAHKCLFRRNTLLEYKDKKIVISTVGNLQVNGETAPIVSIDNHYFETKVFHSLENDTWNDADVSRQIYFESPWQLNEMDDLKANNMHEVVVDEIIKNLIEEQIK